MDTYKNEGLAAALHHYMHHRMSFASSVTFWTSRQGMQSVGWCLTTTADPLRCSRGSDYVGELARQKHTGPNNSGRSPWYSCLPETVLAWRENDSITSRHTVECWGKEWRDTDREKKHKNAQSQCRICISTTSHCVHFASSFDYYFCLMCMNSRSDNEIWQYFSLNWSLSGRVLSSCCY